ncbi:Hypothetical protein YALI2_C00188g [Yarrowia lipolytica]|nr:Hypothetical protein YALI2_C00188g [Yarrowia lipolytica]
MIKDRLCAAPDSNNPNFWDSRSTPTAYVINQVYAADRFMTGRALLKAFMFMLWIKTSRDSFPATSAEPLLWTPSCLQPTCSPFARLHWSDPGLFHYNTLTAGTVARFAENSGGWANRTHALP